MKVIMNKNMFLVMLLVPLTSMCDAIGSKDLQEKYFQKNLELSELGKKIAKTDKLISARESELGTRLRFLADKEIQKDTTQNNKKAITKEEITKMVSAIGRKIDDFISMICSSFSDNKDIGGVVFQELFPQDKNEEFDSLKFLSLQLTFERLLIKLLIEKYENCIKEMANLYAEMNHLTINTREDLL